MDYALLDWDNTLRRGYTLFTWMDYLIDIGTIKSIVREEINIYQEEYKKGIISHDQLAKYTCDIFSESIKGIKKSTLLKEIQSYMRIDNSKLFSFTREIFNMLNEKNILPIIVSGAPSMILTQYCIEFKIYKIFAFVPAVDQNIFTGKVLYNYGYNKGLAVKKICEEMGKLPRFAFGDSVSDYEMLRKAKTSILVCKNTKEVKFNADGIIKHDMSPLAVRNLFKNMFS